MLVQLDSAGRTLADIAAAAGRRAAASAAVIVVCRAALGTLNHTELTIEALTRRGVPVAGLVVGAWPREPTDIDLSNHRYLSRHSVPLLGAVPEHAGRLAPPSSRPRLPAGSWLWLDPDTELIRASPLAPEGKSLWIVF